MQNIKRERCINWDREEKALFRNTLRPYLGIIENKGLTTEARKKKMKAWVEITEKFNVVNVRTRTIKQLMNQWKCHKVNSKKEPSSKREISKTEGGLEPPSSPDILEVTEINSCGTIEVDCTEFFSEASPVDINNFQVLENERKQKEHELRMKNMQLQSQIENQRKQKEHELHMKNLKVQSQIENVRQQKEHELRMKNLDLESQVLTKMLESYK